MKIKPRAIAGIFGALWIFFMGGIDKIFNINLLKNKIIWIIGLICTLVINFLVEKKYYDNEEE